jgi:hypothetical protein
VSSELPGMPPKEKQMNIPTDHLKSADLRVQDVRDIVLMLEAATSHLILPPEVTTALARLRKLIDRKE